MRGKIIAIAGGKGGIGKSVITLGLGASIARLGRTAMVVDLDIGASNIHTLLGYRKTLCGIGDFVQGKSGNLGTLSMPTNLERLRFIPGTGLIPGMANMKYSEKRKILSGIKALQTDYILLDLGAGTSTNTLDFFIWADRGIIVTAPQPSALLNGYEFIKNVVYRKLLSILHSRPYIRSLIDDTKSPNNPLSINTISELADLVKDIDRDAEGVITRVCEEMDFSLILNLVDRQNVSNMGEKLCSIVDKFLSVKLTQVGEVPVDSRIEHRIRKLKSLTDCPEDSGFCQSMTKIAKLAFGISDSILKQRRARLEAASIKIEEKSTRSLATSIAAGLDLQDLNGSDSEKVTNGSKLHKFIASDNTYKDNEL